MAEFRPAPTAPESRPGRVPPAPTNTTEHTTRTARTVNVDPARDPEDILRELANAPKELEFSVAAAKHRIGQEGQDEQEVVEQEARMTARARMTEDKTKWAGKEEGEQSSKFDRIKSSLKQAVPRWWKYGVHSLNTYVKEKNQSHQLLAEAGVQMKSLPYEFLRNVRNLAQENVNAAKDQEKVNRENRRSGMSTKEKIKDKVASARATLNQGRTDDMSRTERGKNKIKNLRELAGRNQRELAAQEVEIVRDLRRVFDARTSQDPEVQRFAAAHPELVQTYRDVLTGDFQASEGLARRLGSEFSNDAIRTVIGEKRAADIVLDGEKAKPVADFFKHEVIIPMLQEGLANGGRIDADRLLEIRTAVQEKFFSKEFVAWRNSLPEETRNSLDLSMSYGTNIIPAVENVLLPQLMSIKDHLQAGSNLKEYVDQMVLKVNVGTLQAGEQGSVQETKREAKFSRAVTNERVMELYRKIESGNGPEQVVPGAYQDALDSASGRLKALGFVGGHNTAGIATGVGLWALQRAGALGGNILVPFIGGAAVAGAVRAGQEKARFTREVEQHGREAARGVTFDEEAKRRNEMKKLEMPMIDIQSGILHPMEQTRRQLEAGQVTDEVLNRAFGLLADTRVRRQMMDNDLNIELYRTTTDQSLDAQKTDLELLRARTAAELRKCAADNPAAMQAYARTLGIDFQPGDNINKVLDPLADALQRNIQRGTEVQNEFQNALSTRIDTDESINKRESAMKRARVLAQAKQGGMTFVAAAGGSVVGYAVTQEITAGIHRAGEALGMTDRPTQTTALERFFGAGEVGPAVEGFTTTGKHAADIMGHRMNIPDGTHWVPDGDSFDLVMDSKPDQVLIDNARFNGDQFVYDQASSLIEADEVTTTTEIRHNERQVLGEGGVWNEWATQTDGREYYGYDTKVSDRNELKFHTIKEGGDMLFQMQNMGFSEASNLNPSRLDVQQVIERGEAQIAFSQPGELNNSIIVNANDVTQDANGRWHATLRLDQNDTTSMLQLANGEQISQADFFRLMIDRDMFNGLPEGDFASEVDPHERNLFLNGGLSGRENGHISAGRLINQDGEQKWQSFATIFGCGDTPPTMDFPEEIKITEIDINVEGTKEPWDPFGIPTPLPWPRRPLEAGGPSAGTEQPLGDPLPPFEYMPFGYPPEYGMGYPRSGVDSVQDYMNWIKRIGYYPKEEPYVRNEEGKWVHADGAEITRDVDRENASIRQYLESQDPAYKDKIKEYAESLPPMDENCRAAIIIPAYLEGKNIYHTLSEWEKQVDKDGNPVDHSTYEIDIIINGPEGYTRDNTAQEIARFKQNHPTVRINVLDVEVPYADGNVGYVRKIITDTVLQRSVDRPNQAGALYIESEDADLMEIDEKSIYRVINKFDSRPELDGLRGKQDLSPNILKENDYLFFDRRAERMVELLLRHPDLKPDRNEDFDFYWNRNITGGWNTAFTAEAYAKIGGYQPAQVGEDVDIGRRISVMRGETNEQGDFIPNVYTVDTVANAGQSNPRRFIYALIRKVPAYSDFSDPDVNRTIRNMSLEEMMSVLDFGQRITPENKENFEEILTNARRFIGWKVKDPAMQEELFGRLTLYLGFQKYKLEPQPDGSTVKRNGPLLQEGADKDQWRSDYHVEADGTVKIDNIDNLQAAFNSYRDRHPEAPVTPDTMDLDMDTDMNTQERFFQNVNETLTTTTGSSESFQMTPEVLGEVLSNEGMLFPGATLSDVRTSYNNRRLRLSGTVHYRGKEVSLDNLVLGHQNTEVNVLDLSYDMANLSATEKARFMVDVRRLKSQIHQRLLDSLNQQLSEENTQWEARDMRFIDELHVDYSKDSDAGRGVADGYRAGEDVQTPGRRQDTAPRPPVRPAPLPPPPPPPGPERGQARYDQYEGNLPIVTEVFDDGTPGRVVGTEGTGTAEVNALELTPAEQERVLARTDIHGHPFPVRYIGVGPDGQQQYQERRLRIEDLERADLLPEYRVKAEDRRILLSKPYQVSQGRTAFMAYVQDEGGNYVPRTFYLSNSQGVWRYLPSYLSNGRDGVSWYDKGFSEQSINAPAVLQQAFNTILTENGGPIDVQSAGNPNFFFAGTAREINKLRAERAEMARGDITYRREVSATPLRLEGTFSAPQEMLEIDPRAKVDPEAIQFADPATAPDFGKSVGSWTQRTNLYGDITVEVLESADGNYRYMFCRDRDDRVWVGGVEDSSRITSLGVRQDWIQAGDLMTPAYEYDSQDDGYGGARSPGSSHYVDMFENYISKIPVIKDYMQARGIRQ
jgi:hypothetical protein